VFFGTGSQRLRYPHRPLRFSQPRFENVSQEGQEGLRHHFLRPFEKRKSDVIKKFIVWIMFYTPSNQLTLSFRKGVKNDDGRTKSIKKGRI
jgi:hypothetical protein